MQAADPYVPFEGGKSAWHDGFERHDFLMNEETLALEPYQAPVAEKFGVKEPAKGFRRCLVIVPKQVAQGRPWSWRGCYWDHQPQAEIELLRRGFHVAYISSSATLRPGKEWDAWYRFLVETHGLSSKPAFVGMSRGGEFAYTWAATHPGSVSCIYADNPGGNQEMLNGLGKLAANDVPLLHICGSIDPLLGTYSDAIEGIYLALGGRISVMVKEGAGHHPHSLRDPSSIADFIVDGCQRTNRVAPGYLPAKTSTSSFYSVLDDYRYFSKENRFITCRGARFAPRYDRHSFNLAGVEGPITVIAPEAAAPGMPWVFRAGLVRRDATVDLALLAKGFHVVTGPVPYNADGPNPAHWNAVYQHPIVHGFSAKPVMEGAGSAAGEVYAWAIENPDRVACIYAENPVLHSVTAKSQPLDNLGPLAKAGVPLLHVCGSHDPALDSDTRRLEKRYRELNGNITVIVNEGVGHYPLAPADPNKVAEFIISRVQ